MWMSERKAGRLQAELLSRGCYQSFLSYFHVSMQFRFHSIYITCFSAPDEEYYASYWNDTRWDLGLVSD